MFGKVQIFKKKWIWNSIFILNKCLTNHFIITTKFHNFLKRQSQRSKSLARRSSTWSTSQRTSNNCHPSIVSNFFSWLTFLTRRRESYQTCTGSKHIQKAQLAQRIFIWVFSCLFYDEVFTTQNKESIWNSFWDSTTGIMSSNFALILALGSRTMIGKDFWSLLVNLAIWNGWNYVKKFEII